MNKLNKISSNRKKELCKLRKELDKISDEQQKEREYMIQHEYMKPIYKWLDSILPTMEDLQKFAHETGKTLYVVFAGINYNIIINNVEYDTYRTPASLKPFLSMIKYTEFNNSRILQSMKTKYKLYGKNKTYPICCLSEDKQTIYISLRHICEYLKTKKIEGVSIHFVKNKINGMHGIYIAYITWGKCSFITLKEENEIRNRLRIK